MLRSMSQSQESRTVPREGMPGLRPSSDEDDTIWQVEDHPSHMCQQVDFHQKTIRQHYAQPPPVREQKS